MFIGEEERIEFPTRRREGTRKISNRLYYEEQLINIIMKITKVALFLGVFALMGLFSSVSVQAQTGTLSSSNNACVSLSSQLRKGHRGAAVMSLQQFLIAKGYLSADSNTGFFGLMTEAAVKSYQGTNGISRLGNVGPMTLGRIQSDIAKACAGSNANASAQMNANQNSAVASAQTSAQIAAGMQLTGVTADQAAKAPVCAGVGQDIWRGDLNNDNIVDMWDLAMLAANYNLPVGQLLNTSADKNYNNDVEFSEALSVAQLFGLKKCTTNTTTDNTVFGKTPTAAQQQVLNVYAQQFGISQSALDDDSTCVAPSSSFSMADVNDDNTVNWIDLMMVGRNYNKASIAAGDEGTDMDSNGVVNFVELLKIAQNFGKTTANCEASATIDQDRFSSTSGMPVISGTAYNVVQPFGISISSASGDKIWASGNLTVTNNRWSTRVNSSLAAGAYQVQVYSNNVLLKTGSITITSNTTQAQYTSDQQLAITYAAQFGISQDGMFTDPTTCTTNSITMGDLDSNGKVNWWDLVLLGRNYNKPAGTLTDPTADRNGDGVVNFSEALGVAQNWMKEACSSNNNTTNNASSNQSSS